MIRTLDRFAKLCNSAADRHWRLLVVTLSLVYFWTAITRATLKAFWHDEIYTIIIASLPSVRAIWDAHRAGLDGMPPLNAILTHFLFAIVEPGPISARLPPMLGVWTLMLASFAIVRRRSNAMTGFAAMLLALYSGASSLAYEARGYGVMLGLFALALFAWSEAASGRRRALYLPVLGIALAAGIWTHLYAVLSIVPILVGEIVRYHRSRTLDRGVMASLAGAVVACLGLLPLMQVAASQSATYFQRAGVRDLPAVYGAIAGGLAGPWTLLAGLAIAATLLLPSTAEDADNSASGHVPAHEVAAGLTTLLIPVLAIAASAFFSGAFVPRYAMSATVGWVLIVPLAAARLRARVAPVLLCLVLGVALAYSVRDVRPNARTRQTPMDYRPVLTSALDGTMPVVVTGTLYLQLWYYADPERRHVLSYVADPLAAQRLLGTDSLDRDYLVLRDWHTVNVQDYESFVAAHQKFMLYAVDSLTWLPRRLEEENAVLKWVGEESGATMYEVTLPRREPAPHSVP